MVVEGEYIIIVVVLVILISLGSVWSKFGSNLVEPRRGMARFGFGLVSDLIWF